MDDLLGGKGITELKVIAHSSGAGKTMTTRALFKCVLRQSGDPWMTANEIQERASAIKGQDVPLATVSHTFSNMKNDGVIVRDGLKVALASRLNENGEAEASPDADDVSATSELNPA